ncbi:MAG: cytochrome c [Alphaproteobacteria bacterium]|nr:cytochrome c [Alphaproteobacteria bacterium]MCB9794733.1 cytochrome c [Alphaproteobacteria bacterium]
MKRLTVFALALALAPLAFAEDTPKPAPPQGDVAKGKSIYTANCMACHGSGAKGDGPAAIALSPKPKDLTAQAFWEGKTDADIKTIIKAGKPGTAMAPFPQLSDKDVADVTAYLRSLKQ